MVRLITSDKKTLGVLYSCQISQINMRHKIKVHCSTRSNCKPCDQRPFVFFRPIFDDKTQMIHKFIAIHNRIFLYFFFLFNSNVSYLRYFAILLSVSVTLTFIVKINRKRLNSAHNNRAKD